MRVLPIHPRLMKAFLPCLLLLLFGVFNACAEGAPRLHRSWRLVFAEEFRGDSLNESRWGRIEYEKAYAVSGKLPDWRRYQSQDAELVELNRPAREGEAGDAGLAEVKGMVTLWGKQGSHFNSAAKEAGILGKDEDTYACGGLSTRRTFAFQYGYVEVRARFDSAAGAWPAIWMVPQKGRPWPQDGEIDILEHLNHDPVVYQTLHYLANDGRSKISGKGVVPREWSKKGRNSWHTYGMLWEKGAITFYVDGKETGRFTAAGSANWPFDRRGNRFYLLIDQQIGGSWVQGAPGGRPMADFAASPAAFDIDYVKVYTTPNFRPRAKKSATKRR